MVQQVMRPGKSERQENRPERQQRKAESVAEGVKLTDVQPLPDIPAVWRLGAVVATQIMGVLALVAALHFGRSILLPVVAGIVVGITLTPVVKLGKRYNIPMPISTILVLVLAVGIIGLVLIFFAAPLTEWIARAPE